MTITNTARHLIKFSAKIVSYYTYW